MPAWKQPLDPSSYLDYAAEWDENFTTPGGDTIASVVVTLPLEATALGLEVDTVTNPVTHDGEVVTIWFSVAPAFRDNAAFAGNGAGFFIPVRITTSQGRIIEQSWLLKVAQQ